VKIRDGRAAVIVRPDVHRETGSQCHCSYEWEGAVRQDESQNICYDDKMNHVLA